MVSIKSVDRRMNRNDPVFLSTQSTVDLMYNFALY